jgi:hypothetical protein
VWLKGVYVTVDVTFKPGVLFEAAAKGATYMSTHRSVTFDQVLDDLIAINIHNSLKR